tara:strand:+ start:206 stop:511 length:306 start_codon:yes stop_codon:yes gene_type:complete
MKLRSDQTFYAPSTKDWARNRKAIAVIKYGETYMKTLKDGSSEHMVVDDQPIILSMRDFVGYVDIESYDMRFLSFECEGNTYEVDYEDLDFYEQKRIKLIE